MPTSRRRRGTFDNHLAIINNYCKSKATIYENINDKYSTVHHKPNNCNSWDCEECRKRKASLLKSRIKAGITEQSWKLLTLTVDPKKVSLHDSLLQFSTWWDVFLKRLRRKFPDIQFIKVLEFQTNGYPHLHIILNKYIYKPWIIKNWTNIGGGQIVDIKPIKNTSVASYVSCYLSGSNEKHIEHNSKFWYYALRRFSFSRNFPLRPWIRRTVVYYSALDWDCSSQRFDVVCNFIINTHVFIAVRTKTYMKYINLRAPGAQIERC